MTTKKIVTVSLNKSVFGKNAEIAVKNRERLAIAGTIALNLMSSPGAGKTSLLVKTLADISNKIRCAVIEGDQQTDNDARRIAETGVPVVQVNTGSACHLDAGMVMSALDSLPEAELLFIENVGNLVCPAAYDLGETSRVTLMSVTEGEDKPAKYPRMFRETDLVILTKTDLLPHLKFDVSKWRDYLAQTNARARVIKLSAETGDGLPEWYSYIESECRRVTGAD